MMLFVIMTMMIDELIVFTDTEAFEYLLARQLGEVPYQDENNNSNEKELTFPEIVAAEACVETCDAMLFISPKSVPVLPQCMGNLLKNQKSAVLNRWHLLGVSCFLIAKPIRKASMAQFLWKMLRKFESNSLHNVLEPWRRYEWNTKSVAQETPLPSV
eukprot:gene4659-20940_t